MGRTSGGIVNVPSSSIFVTNVTADSGVTDNTAALNAAVLALPTGGTIYLPAVTENSWIGCNNWTPGDATGHSYVIRGVGAGGKGQLGGTALGPVVGSGQTQIVNLANNCVQLRDLTVYADGFAQSNVLYGIYVNANDIELTDIYVLNAVNACIFVDTGTGRMKMRGVRCAGSFSQPSMGTRPPVVIRTSTTMSVAGGTLGKLSDSGASFTSADVGRGIATMTNILPGTVITALTDASDVTISDAAQAAIAAGPTFSLIGTWALYHQGVLTQIDNCRFTQGGCVLDMGNGSITSAHFELHNPSTDPVPACAVFQGSGASVTNSFFDGTTTGGFHIVHKKSSKQITMSNITCTDGITGGNFIISENQGGAMPKYGPIITGLSVVLPSSSAYAGIIKMQSGNNLGVTWSGVNVPDGSSAVAASSGTPVMVSGGVIGSQGPVNYQGVLYGQSAVMEAVMAANTGLTASTATTLVSIANVPPGQYLVTGTALVQMTAGGTLGNIDLFLTFTVGTGVISGCAATTRPNTLASGQEVSFTGLLTVTAQGTANLVAEAGAGTVNGQAVAASQVTSTAGACALALAQVA